MFQAIPKTNFRIPVQQVAGPGEIRAALYRIVYRQRPVDNGVANSGDIADHSSEFGDADLFLISEIDRTHLFIKL